MAYAMAFLVSLEEGALRARAMSASQLLDTFKQIKKLLIWKMQEKNGECKQFYLD